MSFNLHSKYLLPHPKDVVYNVLINDSEKQISLQKIIHHDKTPIYILLGGIIVTSLLTYILKNKKSSRSKN